jgi:pimeloyl-ACP methyl ester carboxylesterase
MNGANLRTTALSLLLAAACTDSGPEAGAAGACEGDEGDVHVDAPGGRLEGTLRLPAGCDPRPLVVIYPGSGPVDRDGNSPAAGLDTDSYAQLAMLLDARGVASLRYDKRGVGASRAAAPADPAAFSFDDEVDDARLWAAAYARDPRFSQLVLAGHSEGALWATLVAERQPVAAVVSLAGAGRALGAVLREQLQTQAQSAGFSDELLAQADAILAALEAGMHVESVPPELAQLLAPENQTYLISWMQYDPATELAELDVPILVAQGTVDLQVSVADAQLLADANPRAELLEIEGMTHTLKAGTASQAEQLEHAYADPSLPLHPALVSGLNAFLDEVTGAP